MTEIIRDKQKLETIAKALGYTQSWTKSYGWGSNNDARDVLAITRDQFGKMVSWNPDLDGGDLFKLTLVFGIHVTLDTKRNAAVATYTSLLTGEVITLIGDEFKKDDICWDFVVHVTIKAAFELAKEIIHKRENNPMVI